MDTPQVRIWDAPVRVFHWLLATVFLTAFAIATLTDDDGAAFPLHAMLGLVAVFAVLLRIAWGFSGTRWARFRSFDLRGAQLLRHFRDATRRDGRNTAGHNPASAWFVLVVIAAFLMLGSTGVAAGRGNEAAGEVHEVLAWTVLVLASVHVAGVLLHVAVRKENIIAAMVTGMKRAGPEDAIGSSRPWSAALFLLLVALWAGLLVRGYDASRGTLDVPGAGVTLQLSEAEHDSEEDD